MTKPPLILAALAATALLAACNNQKPAQQAQAGGEILAGSISDAMLPLDTATSQPPLAPKVEKSASKQTTDATGAESQVETPVEQVPEPAKE